MRTLMISLLITTSLLQVARADSATDAPAATTDGSKPERCLTLSSIRDLRVIDNRTLLFEMPHKKFYVNKLSFPCGGLDRGDPIMYRVSSNMICNLDSITVLIPTGGAYQQGPACGLGMFTPITEVEAKKLGPKH